MTCTFPIARCILYIRSTILQNTNIPQKLYSLTVSSVIEPLLDDG